ncbi:hypothetical protein LLEC1_04603 [Akanthomyces lecanii]|uniref:Uncharacterized protein n=1 Tax=Cordyceps confragosa TaxID=2714763 RepID=A0A179I7N9_CORDF|nr:hypothetical protein LLEC1_04603 [Akanthomyces lecanii]
MAEENYLSTPDLSPLEQEVLDEYERLANNMKQASVYSIVLQQEIDWGAGGGEGGQGTAAVAATSSAMGSDYDD